MQAPDIGKLQSCLVVCSGTGLGAAWHLAHITVTNTVTSETAKFVYNNWLDDKKGWTQTLYAGGVDAAQVGASKSNRCSCSRSECYFGGNL